MKHTRVNITRVLNTKAMKKAKRNGRDVIIVPSATLPDDVIMNRIKYPANEIEKSYKGLENSPAPLNHPIVDGKFISAKSPMGINIGWVGAWNENVRRENGRVFLDKVIDVEVANRTDEGKRVLKALEKGEPVHTSTGLAGYLNKADAEDHDFTIYGMEFDHDAILLDYSGAVPPEKGVGIFVNSDGSAEDVEVVNSIWEDTDRELDWAIEAIVRAQEKKMKLPFYERMKAAITEALSGLGAEATTNQEEEEMSNTIGQLSDEVKGLKESMNDLGKTVVDGVTAAFVNSLKPLVDAQAQTLANEKAKEETEKAVLIDRVVKANFLSEDAAKEAPIATLKALVANIKEPGQAASIRPGQLNQSGGVVTKFKPPVAKEAS